MDRMKTFFCGLLGCLLLCVVQIQSQESRPVSIRPLPESVKASISDDEAEARLNDAILLFERGKAEAAIYSLQQLHRAAPTNYKVLFKLGEIAIATKNWAYSIEVLQKAAFLRPKDIDVRMILMDIYRAYQMPLQEIIVGREVIALDPDHKTALSRLASLFHDQAMQEDEIAIRQRLAILMPDNYENLKKLAELYDTGGRFWEAAQVYEQIRRYFPAKKDDMIRLAALYDQMEESFCQLQVLDHIAEYGGGRGWLNGRAKKRQRQMLRIFDNVQSNISFLSESSDDFDTNTLLADAEWTHLRIRSTIDFSFFFNYDFSRYVGNDSISGNVDVQSGTFGLRAIKNWKGSKYKLILTLGTTPIGVSGQIAVDSCSSLDPDDFPMLEDRDYGGIDAIGGLVFSARTSSHSKWVAALTRMIVDDLDARMRLVTGHKLALGYSYLSGDQTELGVDIDLSSLSDGNVRSHGRVFGDYIVIGSHSMRDYRGRRKGFLVQPPHHYLKFGYAFDYFNDKESSPFYESYENEAQHQINSEGQLRLKRLTCDDNLYLMAKIAFLTGKSIENRVAASAGIWYRNMEYENELGLLYTHRQESIEPGSQENATFSGNFSSHQVLLKMVWHF